MQTTNFANRYKLLRGTLIHILSSGPRKRVVRFSIHTMFMVSLLFGVVSPAFGQHCCDSEGEVTIAYKGIMCAFYPYQITLNGTVAN